ncbi:nucleotide exchange factor GrpE [Pseudonocardia sp.]|uniref:nucleotide exchange factor GrpE n=1 Tax=Pseudonocardia sp. TaxID=60912 RepID=UPI0031FBC58B
MSTPNGPEGQGPAGEQEEPVVVRDRRRIDPLTGEVRAPAGDAAASPAGAGPAPAGSGDEPPAESLADPRIADLEKQLEERTADLQRVSAEYANYRRRVDRDREAVLHGAKASFVADLLTVLDDIERAEQHGDLNGPFKSVADKVVGVVEKLGLDTFGAEGELFDPSLHEAVQHEPADAPGATVTVLSAVLRRGYRLKDRVLRPAMVTVVDKPEPEFLSDEPVPPAPADENDPPVNPEEPTNPA